MRVLVVSNDASLAVALSLMVENCEVVSISSAAEVSSQAAESFSGTVIDVGTTHGGLEVVRELADAGVASPFFLLGDVEASVPHPEVDLLVRPFTLEQLNERLSALTRQPSHASYPTFEDRSTSRFGASLLARFMRRAEAEREPERARGSDLEPDDHPQESPAAAATAAAAGYDALDSESSQARHPELTGARGGAEVFAAVSDVQSSYHSLAAAVPATEKAAEQAEKDLIEAQSVAESAAERLPPAEPESPDGGGVYLHRPKPQIHPRFRGQAVGATDAPEMPSKSALRRVLALVEELEAMVGERPELLDLRLVADRVVEEIVRELHPDGATVWVPREDKTYEAYATRGLDAAVGIRVPQGQSLFLAFKADVDAVLIAPLDVSQRPVSGIPGLLGGSLIASALRLDETLFGVVIATGTGFTVSDRDRLAFLASRAVPEFAIAGLVEQLRARRFVPHPETTKRSV